VDEWQGPLFGISTEQTIEPNSAHEAFGFGEEGVYLGHKKRKLAAGLTNTSS
jgi:hypothetical protein